MCRDVEVEDPRGADGIARCWEVRGCAGLFGFNDYMEAECPHGETYRHAPCPASCAFTRCQRPWHRPATSIEELANPSVNRAAAINEQCRCCLHFIEHGPRSHACAPSAVDRIK